MLTSMPAEASQVAILGLLVAMLVVFALDRFRIEMVACSGLAAAVALGLVPMRAAFDGFANPAVVTVVEILVIVQALRRARLLDAAARGIGRLGLSERELVLALCAAAAGLSAFMNNIGALALMLPVVATLADVNGVDPRKLLIPVSYATLLGGTCSLIGTPANLLVSQALGEAGGGSIPFFAFAWAGLPMTIAGLAVIVTWIPGRFPSSERAQTAPPPNRPVVAEVVIAPGSPLAGMALPAVAAEAGVHVHTVLRAGRRVFGRSADTRLAAGDLAVVSGELATIDALVDAGAVEAAAAAPSGAVRQAIVIMPHSTLVGSRPASLEILERFGVGIAAVSVRTSRIEGRLGDLTLSVGDVLVLEGSREAVAALAAETDTLQLVAAPAERPAGRATAVAPLAFAVGIGLAATGLLEPEIAFGVVVLTLMASGTCRLRTALAEIDWSIIVMLATMIPLGAAVETTGAATGLASTLVPLLPHSRFVLLGGVFLLAVLVTPFVNNASTAIVLAPIALEVARSADLSPVPFLIAVAAGASADFLTPFGHHNNTLVMTIGGYRFSDFVRCGWPVTLAAMVAGLLGLFFGAL